VSRAEAVTALAVSLLPSCGSVERAWAAAVARRRAGRLPMFSRPMSLIGVAAWK